MAFVAKKVLQLVFVLLVVSFLTFLMLDQLEGDVVDVRCGLGCTPEQRDALRTEFGLDDPVPVQYARWLKELVVDGNLGASGLNGVPVSESLADKLPVTLFLVVYSQAIALTFGLLLGMSSARKPGGLVDRLSSAVAGIAISVPNYVVAFVVILLFAVTIPIFSVTAQNVSIEWLLPDIPAQLSNLGNNLYLLFLPAKQIMRRHAFRPSTFSLATVAGINMGRLIGGTIIIEAIFAINGMGLYVVQSINQRDAIPLQGAVLVIATAYVLINFIVDLLYAYLDPRIRHARAAA